MKPPHNLEHFEDPGPKWVNIDMLNSAGKLLTRFEPDEVVSIKGHKFKVQLIQLAPPKLVLVPVK